MKPIDLTDAADASTDATPDEFFDVPKECRRLIKEGQIVLPAEKDLTAVMMCFHDVCPQIMLMDSCLCETLVRQPCMYKNEAALSYVKLIVWQYPFLLDAASAHVDAKILGADEEKFGWVPLINPPKRADLESSFKKFMENTKKYLRDDKVVLRPTVQTRFQRLYDAYVKIMYDDKGIRHLPVDLSMHRRVCDAVPKCKCNMYVIPTPVATPKLTAVAPSPPKVPASPKAPASPKVSAPKTSSRPSVPPTSKRKVDDDTVSTVSNKRIRTVEPDQLISLIDHITDIELDEHDGVFFVAKMKSNGKLVNFSPKMLFGTSNVEPIQFKQLDHEEVCTVTFSVEFDDRIDVKSLDMEPDCAKSLMFHFSA